MTLEGILGFPPHGVRLLCQLGADHKQTDVNDDQSVEHFHGRLKATTEKRLCIKQRHKPEYGNERIYKTWS